MNQGLIEIETMAMTPIVQLAPMQPEAFGANKRLADSNAR